MLHKFVLVFQDFYIITKNFRRDFYMPKTCDLHVETMPKTVIAHPGLVATRQSAAECLGASA